MSVMTRMGLTASALLLATSAFAADLPSKKAPAAMAPIAMPRAYS